jgi:DNA repair exonuclease SbcCD ATPase subunit
MKPINLEAKNFLSWAHLKYSFEDRVIALSGDNKTEEDQGGNGSGKSGIQQMIYYAYTGNNIRNVLDRKLVRRGTEEAWVLLETYCPQRKETLEIQRTIPIKGSSKLSLKINGNPVNFANVMDGNRFILEWLAISPEDLKSYYIICKECYKSFFRSSNTEKLALISRFINFSYIDETKDVINSQIDALNAKKRSYEQEKNILEGKLIVYSEQLEKELNRDLKKEREEKIASYEAKIHALADEVETIDKGIEERNQTYNELSRKAAEKEEFLKLLENKRKDLPDITSFQETIKELKDELFQLKESQNTYLNKQEINNHTRGKIKQELQKIHINLAGKITCPKCKHEFLTLKDTSLELELAKQKKLFKEDKDLAARDVEITNQLKEYEAVISDYITAKNSVEEEEEEARNKIRGLENQISSATSDLSSVRLKMKSITERNENALTLLEDRAKEVESLEKKINQVDEEIKDIDTKFIEDKITEITGNIKVESDKITEITDQIFKKNQWINRFKEFKMYLAIEQIKNIQAQANTILQKERSDLRLIIESFKKDSKGNVKDEITPYVFREQAESFWYYSGGERARVEIALILAIQTMINATNRYGGLKLLYLDEITEGLSEEGLYNVIEALNFIQYPVLITTQVSNQNVKCAALKVEKVDGISRVV